MEESKCLMNCLKRSYRETPIEGPEAKRVRFSDIQEHLTAQFPSLTLSTSVCSTAVQEAFPQSQRKRFGKERHNYIIGVEISVEQQQLSDPVQILQAENEELSLKVHQLEARIQELEAQNISSNSSRLLVQHLDSLLQHGRHTVHGPNTPDHFNTSLWKASLTTFGRMHPVYTSSFFISETQSGMRPTIQYLQSKGRQSCLYAQY